MAPVDRSSAPVSLLAIWTACGQRFAAAVGALIALISLLEHTPVWVASARGASAWFAVLLLTKVSAQLARRTYLPVDVVEVTEEEV